MNPQLCCLLNTWVKCNYCDWVHCDRHLPWGAEHAHNEQSKNCTGWTQNWATGKPILAFEEDT